MKTNSMRYLDKNKIIYKVHCCNSKREHDGVTVAKNLGKDLDMTYKTLVLQGKSKACYICVLPVNLKIDYKKVAKIFGEKDMYLLDEKQINQVTGYLKGSCSPIGTKTQLRTVIHSKVLKQVTIVINSGKLGIYIELNPKDLIDAVDGIVSDIAIQQENCAL